MYTFELSSVLFQGFRIRLSREELYSLDYVCMRIHQELKDVLESHHFVELMNHLQTQQWHIHDYTLQDLLQCSVQEEEQRIWYICECHGNGCSC